MEPKPKFLEEIRQIVNEETVDEAVSIGAFSTKDPGFSSARRLWKAKLALDIEATSPYSMIVWEDKNTVEVRVIDENRVELFDDDRPNYNKITIPGAGSELVKANVANGSYPSDQSPSEIMEGDVTGRWLRFNAFAYPDELESFEGPTGMIQDQFEDEWVVEDESGDRYGIPLSDIDQYFEPAYQFIELRKNESIPLANSNRSSSDILQHRILTILDQARDYHRENQPTTKEILQERWGLIDEGETIHWEGPISLRHKIRSRGFDIMTEQTPPSFSEDKRVEVYRFDQSFDDPFVGFFVDPYQGEKSEGVVMNIETTTPRENVAEEARMIQQKLDEMNCSEPPKSVQRSLRDMTRPLQSDGPSGESSSSSLMGR